MRTEQNKGLIIAVDGYSSTGKSTVAKQIAQKMGYIYIDTGAMYRAITLFALEQEHISKKTISEEALKKDLETIKIEFRYNPENQNNDTYLNGKNVEQEIRKMEVAEQVSKIAGIPFVREYLVDQQREMGKNGGVIMDGRDIGSTVFPQADIKFFLTASPEVRARRRYEELISKGEQVTYEEVEENVRTRDHLDETRSVSPLVKTADAILVDNSRMNIEEEVEYMMSCIRSKMVRDGSSDR